MLHKIRYILAFSFSCLLVPLTIQADEASNFSTLDDTSPVVITNLAPPSILLKTAIIGSSTVTNTGHTVVHGDLDISPGSALTGFPPGVIVNGAFHSADAVATTAHSYAQAYYNQLALSTCPPANNLTGQDLGGKTLKPGVYCFSSSAQLTGILTLHGNKKSSYTFQIGSTFTTASNAHVVLTGGVKYNNVNWLIGSSATLGTGTEFYGNINAVASITITTGTVLIGRAWALNGAVTLDTNIINPQL